MLSAGRVLIKPEGEYSPLKTYEMLDYVSYNGSSYIAKKTTTGNLPTNTEYWQLSASGAQSQNVASNFAEVEGSDIASSPHAINDVFVNKDGKLLKATLAISIGDTIVIDTNCEPTTVEDLISYLSTQVSTLDSSNKKLNGITEIAVQTDLHTLSLGEFYKDKTSFYVTNGPEEVDEVASAIFRLTVESALDGSSTTRLLTLKTPGGKVYTQNYDGSSWGDWEQVAFESEVELKQNITDNNLQTTSKTVPGAINELFLKSQAISNPNLLDNPWFTVNQRGQSSYSGTAGYSYDRWYRQQSGITVSLDSDECIVIQNTDSGFGNFKQPFSAEFIKAINGRTLTLSVLFKDGTIKSNTSQNVDLSQNTSYCSITLADGTSASIRSTSISSVSLQIAVKGNITIPAIRAFKLELGSVSTLAMDTAPNFQQELAKCMRYFVRYTSPSFFEAYTYNATTARFGIPLPVPMRVNPVFSVEDITNLQFVCNGNGQDLSSSQTIANNSYGTVQKVMQINTLTSGLFTANQVGVLKLNSGYIDLSADL